MIAYLKWSIIDLETSSIILLTYSWIWYKVGISEITYAELSQKTDLSNLEFYIYHHITENAESLFWFIEKSEKQVFEELIKISGIWGRVALSILSLWIDNLSRAVWAWDNKTIESIKGIWKKMAEKIILELKDKDFINTISSETNKQTPKINKSIWDSVKSTLTAMWYNPKEIDKELLEIPEEMKEVGEIMQYVIKQL